MRGAMKAGSAVFALMGGKEPKMSRMVIRVEVRMRDRVRRRGKVEQRVAPRWIWMQGQTSRRCRAITFSIEGAWSLGSVRSILGEWHYPCP
jgi:hypothetical protein